MNRFLYRNAYQLYFFIANIRMSWYIYTARKERAAKIIIEHSKWSKKMNTEKELRHTKITRINTLPNMKKRNKFILKSGDNVWVNIIPKVGDIETKQVKIAGFRAYGIFYENSLPSWHHYSDGLFYGFGYHNDGYAIVCKKKWHLYPAIIVEKIRLNLPLKIVLWLGLEKYYN